MPGRDLLGIVRVQPGQIVVRELGRALLGHGALDHGHGVLCHDADRGVDRIDLALAELALDRDHLGLEGDQHIANVALQEGRRRITPALAQHRHVLVELAHEVGRLRVAAAGLAHRAPGGQVGIATVTAGLGVDDHDLDVGADQIAPILDVLGIAVAHEKQHGRCRGRSVVGELLGPVLGDHAVVGQELHVGRGVEGHHIGGQAVVDRARLGAGAAVRLVDLHVHALGLLVVRGESGVVVLVELARHVVRHIEQLVLRHRTARSGQRQGCQQSLELQGMHGFAFFIDACAMIGMCDIVQTAF